MQISTSSSPLRTLGKEGMAPPSFLRLSSLFGWLPYFGDPLSNGGGGGGEKGRDLDS